MVHPLLVVADHARPDSPQSRHAGAGQSRQVDEARRPFFLGICQGVGQDEPSFGIGILDFYGLAIIHGQDIIDMIGHTGRNIFDQRDDRQDIDGILEQHQRPHDTHSRCGPSHIVLHKFQISMTFKGQAAAVIGDALADDAQDFPAVRVPLIGDGQELRRIHAALADGDDAAHMAFFQSPLIEVLNEDIIALEHPADDVGELARRQIVRRHVDQIPGGIDAFIDRSIHIAHRIEFLRPQAMGQDIDIANGPALGLAFIAGKFIIAVQQAIDEGAQIHIQGISHDSQLADAFLHSRCHEAPGHTEIFIRRITDGLPFQADEEICLSLTIRQEMEDMEGCIW